VGRRSDAAVSAGATATAVSAGGGLHGNAVAGQSGVSAGREVAAELPASAWQRCSGGGWRQGTAGVRVGARQPLWQWISEVGFEIASRTVDCTRTENTGGMRGRDSVCPLSLRAVVLRSLAIKHCFTRIIVRSG
jgi:hypothetical protein